MCAGHALAAGTFLLSLCDYRMGSAEPFKSGPNETAISMLPLPVFGHELALNRLSPRFLTKALIQSEIFSSEDALEARFPDQVIEKDDLYESAKAKTLELSCLPSVAYGKMKRDTSASSLERIKQGLQV